MGSVLAETLGRQLLHSDIWFLAEKCTNLVKRIHEPLERSVVALDNILTLEDEDSQPCSAAAPEVNVLNNYHMEHNMQVVDDYFNRQQFFGE